MDKKNTINKYLADLLNAKPNSSNGLQLAVWKKLQFKIVAAKFKLFWKKLASWSLAMAVIALITLFVIKRQSTQPLDKEVADLQNTIEQEIGQLTLENDFPLIDL